ncbi:ankyrin repeat domain-containing protein [Marinobacterium marinum]|uniref:Ankyrin repeat domain-containing protein n=1 Tax=Marinobacterium marinum TaxID=2756129 RepID=A0A7W1WZZ8_9GAMM|nr:ankyrin repeat domain-containing protein [Marinobacterium marinum]MBA4503196.1 ankyrin repeat domain-containing protein [Marinobacterium marinum]
MLNTLFTSRYERLLTAIDRNDLDKAVSLLAKLEAEQLQAPGKEGHHALERAILADAPAILEQLLKKAGRPLPTAAGGTPLICLALRQTDSLPYVTLLLQAGEDPNLLYQGTPLLHLCVEHCPPDRLMLHLSRLLQQGADIDRLDANNMTLFQRALPHGDPALLQFLLQSGARCETDWLDELEDNTLATRLRRVLDDLRIQKMMLGR